MNTFGLIEWMITEPVKGKVLDDTHTKVESANSGNALKSVIVTFAPDGKLLFDGRYVDLGDDLVTFLGMLDEIADYGFSEPIPDQED